MSRSFLLMGPSGSGKTTMGCLTALHKPVLLLDMDRKAAAMEHLQTVTKDGQLSIWELSEPLIEENLKLRLSRLTKNEKPLQQPRGWTEFAAMCAKLDESPEAKAAGTWFIDSWTRLTEHLKRQITFIDPKGRATMSERNYGSFLQIQEETITALIDGAKATGKDLIVSVHEKLSELPRETTMVYKWKTEEGDVRRDTLGVMDLKIGPSVEGQFATKMASYFDEVYALHVEVDGKGMPVYRCRVMASEVRDLRTSHKVQAAEFPPDFAAIWG